MIPLAYISNIITISRALLAPLIVWLLASPEYTTRILGLGVYTLAALSDALDGYLARRYAQTSALGQFLDPLADKIVVLMLFAFFWTQNLVSWWVPALMLARDLVVTGLRIAHPEAKLAPSRWGKLKTVVQFVCMYALMLQYIYTLTQPVIVYAITSLVLIVMGLTVFSGLQYLVICGRYRAHMFKHTDLYTLFSTISQVFIRLCASLGGVGYVPIAPGTAASGVACFFWAWAYTWGIYCYAALLAISACAGVYISSQALILGYHDKKHTGQDQDPSWIVIDEFVGMGVALTCIPRVSWQTVLCAFILFRIFDISKLWPCNLAERAPRGWGIMLDDLCAGLMVAGLFFVFYA